MFDLSVSIFLRANIPVPLFSTAIDQIIHMLATLGQDAVMDSA
jgi:hypothetical protein